MNPCLFDEIRDFFHALVNKILIVTFPDCSMKFHDVSIKLDIILILAVHSDHRMEPVSPRD